MRETDKFCVRANLICSSDLPRVVLLKIVFYIVFVNWALFCIAL